MRYTLISIAFILILVVSCTKKNQEQLMLEAEKAKLCSEDTLLFGEHIAPIFAANCMPCHSSAQQSGGITLETYSDINLVVSAGLLPGVIRHDPGFAQMPKNSPKLDECYIRAIEVWISQGALNN